MFLPMLRRVLVCSTLALLGLGSGGLLTSCSNGGSGPASDVAAACGVAGGFCLANCNLGCDENGGCSVTDIAPNQPIELQFSQVLDPGSVDTSSVSIRTSSGQEPLGLLAVDGNVVRFIPEVRTVQGQTFFGFSSNETYTVTIPGGAAPNAVESTSGDRLNRTFTCTIRISRPIVDLNEAPPRATLISPIEPASGEGAPRDSVVVLEFDEFIDAGPFFGTSGDTAPIRFRVRRTSFDTAGNRVCNPNSAPFALSGQPRLSFDLIRGTTTVTFAPLEVLPPDVCLEAEVTTLVRDLAGRRAAPDSFRVLLVAEETVPREFRFDFGDDQLLDRDNSGGIWGGGVAGDPDSGTATFATVGGDGRHGEFRALDGDATGPGVFTFSTDNQLLSGNDDGNDLSFFSAAPLIDDGFFYFSEMVVPAGQTIRFVGDNPARIFVRGRCQIDGRIELRGQDLADGFDAVSAGPPFPGQAGSVAGAGGGDGGSGAFAGDNSGNPVQPEFNNFNGFDGGDVQVAAGSGFGMAFVGTGGRGGQLFPANNDLSTVPPPPVASPLFQSATDYLGGPGSGGGFVTAGGQGIVVAARATLTTGTAVGALGPTTPEGLALAGFAAGKPLGIRSDEFYVVGGAGGGGGGSHPLFAVLFGFTPAPRFWAGSGGAGGGGGLGLFVGNDLQIGAGAVIDVSGGSAGDHFINATQATAPGITGYPSGGGGGSGGSVLIQVEGAAAIDGQFLALGGAGSPHNFMPPGIAAVAPGGAGGEGFVRIEAANRTLGLTDIGTVMPAPSAANVGEVEEPNDLVGFNSLFVGTNELFAPVYDRYVIEATVDGVDVIFSDDPTFRQSEPSPPIVMPAVEGAALQFWVQGVDIDPATGEPPFTVEMGETVFQRPAPWRRSVGFAVDSSGTLNGDGRTGFRFALIRDARVSSNVIVRSLTIQYRS